MKKNTFDLHVIISFDCKFNYQDGSVEEGLKATLEPLIRGLKLGYSVGSSHDKCADSRFGYSHPVVVTFCIRQEVSSHKTAHYLYQILNGYAGLCTLIPGVESFSFSVL